MPEAETEEIRVIYRAKGFKGELLEDIVQHIISDRTLWLDQMMKEELELEEVKQKEIYLGSVIVGISALVGSFIPLTAYFFMPLNAALPFSVIVSAIALFIVGAHKAKVTVGSPGKSGLQMVLIGLGAALAGYLIGKLFGAQ